MICAPRPPPRPPPALVSVPTSRPCSVTIRLKTSPTERTPSPGFQLYFPAMTRARPANLSDSVPASLDRAACVVSARNGARLSTAAIATAHAIVLVRIVLIDISATFKHREPADGFICSLRYDVRRNTEQPRRSRAPA